MDSVWRLVTSQIAPLARWSGALIIGVTFACAATAWAQTPAPRRADPITQEDLPASQRPAPIAVTGWKAPRTPWGDPDLSGVYSSSDESGVPFERPAEFEGRSIDSFTPAELAVIVKQRQQQTIERAPTLSDFPGATSPMHWFEFYNANNTRPWMVSDPPDGRIPPLTTEAQARIAARAAARRGRGPADSWEDRSLWDRCITRGIPTSMLPTLYGNSYFIQQAPGYVTITYEMVHDTRVIPLDVRPHVGTAIRQYLGDPRGHWEGDTLIVETTNFTDKTAYRNSSENLRMVERFRSVGPAAVEWSVTFEDAQTWTRPWTFAMNLTKLDDSQQPFEYACHEGNYGLRNILTAARAEDAAVGAGRSARPADRTDSDPPHVVGLVHFIHATDTLEATTAFYKDVFGLEAPLRDFPNPAVAPLNNVPGIKLRASRPLFPDKTGFEITEFTSVVRHGGQAAPTDPGAITLMIPVRDLDVVLASFKKRGTPIVTTSGGPELITTTKGRQRAIVVRDPDGYLVWAIEAAPADATEPGIMQPGVTMVVAVQDIEVAAKFYRGLGFELSGSSSFASDDALAKLFGLPASSRYRAVAGLIPGTVASRVAFYEWQGVARTPFHLNVYDPGAGGFVLRVTKLDEMLARMKADGLRVISAGGVPVQFGPTSRNVFVVDPNGMNLELTESTPAPSRATP